MGVSTTRTKCPVEGCPGMLDINTDGHGKTVERCECCEKRKAWELANVPPEARPRCKICSGALPAGEGKQGGRGGMRYNSACRPIAARASAAKNRLKAKQKYEREHGNSGRGARLSTMPGQRTSRAIA